MADWIRDLERELEGISPSSRKIKSKEDNGHLIIFMFSLLVFLGFVVFNKFNTNNVNSKPIVQQNVPVIQDPSYIPNQTSEYESLKRSIKRAHDKLRLLGSLQNNNFAVYNRYHPDSSYIYLNRDWTIDRVPGNLKLQDDDEEFFREYVKD